MQVDPLVPEHLRFGGIEPFAGLDFFTDRIERRCDGTDHECGSRQGKRCAETLFFDYRRQHNIPIKVVRIFNTYGPRMHPNDGRVVSNFVVQALRGEDITVYGDGSQTRSFCYVDDLVRAIHLMMETPHDITGPTNIGNPNEFTIRELAEAVTALTGTKSKIIEKPLPSDDPKQRKPNIDKAREQLGWEPGTQLKEGLVHTIAYFDDLLKKNESWSLRASATL